MSDSAIRGLATTEWCCFMGLPPSKFVGPQRREDGAPQKCIEDSRMVPAVPFLSV